MSEPLIDSHIHFCTHERLNELERYRRSIGAEKICVLSLPVKQRINFNPEVLFAKARLGARCYALAGFDYSPLFCPRGGGGEEGGSGGGGRPDLDLPGQVERLQRLGFDGLKIFLGKPSFQRELGLRLNDPEVLVALKRAESLGMPVLIHIADPLIFWSYESIPGFVPPGWQGALSAEGGSTGIPSYEDLQHQAVDVLRACPDLTVIFPHLLSMGQDITRLSGILEQHPRVYLDLAPGLYFYYELHRQRAAAREFFSRYAGRILFGTDSFWFPEWFSEFPHVTVKDNLERGRQLLGFLASDEQLDNPFVPTRRIQETVRGLGLDEGILHKIRYDNFLSIYPEVPREIDGPACLEYLDDFVDQLAMVEAGEAGVRIKATAEQLRLEMYQLLQGRLR